MSSGMRLFEILHEFPALVELADSIDPTRAGDPDETLVEKLTALTTRSQNFEWQLTQWYHNLETDQRRQSDRGLFWPEESTLYRQLPESSPDRIFPFLLCFPNPAIAEQLVLYWTALLLIGRKLTQKRLLQKEVAVTDPLYDLGSAHPAINQNMADLALKITQSLEYFLHPDMGLMEMNFIGFPMSIGMAQLKAMGMKEVLWYDVIRRRLRNMDTGLADFLEEIAQKGGGLEALKLLYHGFLPWLREMSP